MPCSRFAIAMVALLAAFRVLTPPAAQAAVIQPNLEFSEFAAGHTFPNASLPQLFYTLDGIFEIGKHNDSNSANASIWNFFPIGQDANALFLAANARLDIHLPIYYAEGGFFVFLDMGGQNFLEINGEVLDFSDAALSGDDTHFIGNGGVNISSVALPVAGARKVTLDGQIYSLGFVGQELLVDSINLTVVPEPATWLTLALGGCALVALRRREMRRRRC